MISDTAVPRRRARDLTQRYGEPDEIYDHRVQQLDSFERRIERADSVRVVTIVATEHVLGI